MISRDAFAPNRDSVSPPLHFDPYSGYDDSSGPYSLVGQSELKQYLEYKSRCFVALTPVPERRSLSGVYNPVRFRVLSNCEIGIGVVSSITLQGDGSSWIDIAVDREYSKLIGPGNISHRNGLLVLEDSSTDQAMTLSVGERIAFVGPLVDDTKWR